MKRIFLLFIICTCLFCTILHAQEDLLLFCGGSLWSGRQIQNAILKTSLKMKFIDTANLAGFGGADIRKFKTDAEPEKNDGITPEFKQLDKYKVVMFTAIPADLLDKMLTDERIKILEEYVQNGGTLVLNCFAPERLGNLLPINYQGGIRKDNNLIEERPNLSELAMLPESWKKLGIYRKATAKKEAVVHSVLRDNNSNIVSDSVVSMPYGKGKVIFYNGHWKYDAGTITDFCHWAYTPALMIGLISHVGKLGVDLEAVLNKTPERAPDKKFEKIDYVFTEKNTKLNFGGDFTIEGNKVKFANGMILTARKSGDVDIRYPNVKESMGLNSPIIKASAASQDFVKGSYEAISGEAKLKTFNVKWKFDSITENGDCVILNYSAPDSKMRWEFTALDLNLDGRRYFGYADRIIIEKLPVKLEQVEFNSRVPKGKIRRLTCYTSPRGYLETVLSKAEGKIADSKEWQFFNSGQPFAYASNEDGIFFDIINEAMPCHVRFTARAEDDPKMNKKMRIVAGFRDTPLELPYLLHLFSPGKENGNNDYLAVYQFARQHLRDRYNIKNYSLKTLASCYLNGRNFDSVEKAIMAAKELNFRSIWLTYVPMPMEDIAGERLKTAMQLAHKHGLTPYVWTPGGYGHGDAQKVFVEHPDWFVKTKKGTFFKYFGQHSVGDFNNHEFFNYFLGLLDQGIANGMSRVYFDMGGAVSNNINYATPNAEMNLVGLTKLFQELDKRNVPFAVEGMNPLGIDRALMRPEVSYPMVGKEFAYNNATPFASVDYGKYAGLYFDYWRLGMFNSTINIDVDGYLFNMERVPNELARVKEIAEYNLTFNKAHEFVTAPFVRETDFGSAWIGENTGALFFEHSVRELKLSLPEGWEVVDNQSLKDIKAHSMILLQKTK